ncbi:hypothetical protein RDWZM_006600 [Blomia tropicalis]|uniref:Uncharacterized protein n=1 Tax=Blomia tropicalis TaxID=40697 RepID=A0A9Q0M6G8_BLOTA|nr:hypothetical protein RDWZM_006600 [Blomia tropicalis]
MTTIPFLTSNQVSGFLSEQNHSHHVMWSHTNFVPGVTSGDSGTPELHELTSTDLSKFLEEDLESNGATNAFCDLDSILDDLHAADTHLLLTNPEKLLNVNTNSNVGSGDTLQLVAMSPNSGLGLTELSPTNTNSPGMGQQLLPTLLQSSIGHHHHHHHHHHQQSSSPTNGAGTLISSTIDFGCDLNGSNGTNSGSVIFTQTNGNNSNSPNGSNNNSNNSNRFDEIASGITLISNGDAPPSSPTTANTIIHHHHHHVNPNHQSTDSVSKSTLLVNRTPNMMNQFVAVRNGALRPNTNNNNNSNNQRLHLHQQQQRHNTNPSDQTNKSQLHSLRAQTVTPTPQPDSTTPSPSNSVSVKPQTGSILQNALLATQMPTTGHKSKPQPPPTQQSTNIHHHHHHHQQQQQQRSSMFINEQISNQTDTSLHDMKN